jgi:ABC-type glycerol-3-phosphate transport system substrate-binding protein
MKYKKLLAAFSGIAVAVALTGCSTGSPADSNGASTINYWTWDPSMVSAMTKCIPGFEKENPGTTVKISRYNVPSYFTKLTADFAAGDAPDVFQASGQYFPTYIAQDQISDLGPLIKKHGYDVNQFGKGITPVTYTDGKTYGLPVDWVATAIYYNKDLLAKAGVTPAEMQSMTWNPQDGGTFGKVVKALTVDNKGVHGNQPGFDPKNVKTYGINLLVGQDPTGSETFSSFAGTLGWKPGNKDQFPTKVPYGDKAFVDTTKYLRSLSDDGFAPTVGQFGSNTSFEDQLTSGKVAMIVSGSWDASSFAQNKDANIGIAPAVASSATGKRLVQGGSDTDFIWKGSKQQDKAFKWLSYMTSPACQTIATDGTASFFPANPEAFAATAKSVAAKGLDLSVFAKYQQDGSMYGAPSYANGAALQTAIVPLFQKYYEHQVGDDVFTQLEETSKQVIAQK